MIPKRTIFFDGLCPLCSREIALFKRRVTDGSLAFVDIAAPGFVAAEYGLDPIAVHETMHVRDEVNGRMLTGIDALAGMWECVPGFRWMAAMTRLPILRPLCRLGYRLFAWIRPRLPRRRLDCSTSQCPTQRLS